MVFISQTGHDGQPYGDIGGRHENLTAHDAAGPLECFLERNPERALAIGEGIELEAVMLEEGSLGKKLAQFRFGDRKAHANGAAGDSLMVTRIARGLRLGEV